jgi:branched-chain amino acid transport system permease protein
MTLWRVVCCLVPLGLAVMVRDRFTLSILAVASVQALYVASWDLVGGLSGQPTLGHALPMGAGAYLAALLGGLGVVPFPAVIAGGALAGSLAAALQGTLSAKLDRVSVALVTLATAECAHELSAMLRLSWPGGLIVGGNSGVPTIVFPPNEAAAARLAAALLAAGAIGLLWIRGSGLGLAMRTVRADARLAAASGIDVVHVRVLAFAIGGGVAGLCGGLVASLIGRASPDMLSLEPSLLAPGIAGSAGPGTLVGPALTAYAVTAALQWLDVPGHLRVTLYAVLLIAAGLRPRTAT